MWAKLLGLISFGHETRHPRCDCSACCDQCGHEFYCMSREGN